jgi:hypothetical protein
MATLTTGGLLNCCANTLTMPQLPRFGVNTMRAERAHCKAFTKGGKPCGAAPTPSGLCFFHGNPNKAVELGRIGGKRNRRPERQTVDLVPKLENESAVIASLYDEVKTGSIKPPVANVLIKLRDLQVRMHEKTAMENEISKLQEQVRMLKAMIKARDIKASMSDFERAQVK